MLGIHICLMICRDTGETVLPIIGYDGCDISYMFSIRILSPILSRTQT